MSDPDTATRADAWWLQTFRRASWWRVVDAEIATGKPMNSASCVLELYENPTKKGAKR